MRLRVAAAWPYFAAFLAAALLALVVSLDADEPHIIRTHTETNPDGTQSTKYPCVGGVGCKPPGGSTLTCDNSAQPALTGEIVGVAYSHNVRQYFSGSASGTASLAVQSVTGDDAASNGFAISSNNLVNAGTDPDLPGSGSLRVTGTDSGNVVDCSALAWVFSNASGTGIKWHPGFYPWYSPAAPGQAGVWLYNSAVRANLDAFIAANCADTSIKGVRVYAVWAAFEGSTHGNYTAGFAMVHDILDDLRACNKYLILDLATTIFLGHGSDWTVSFPAYLVQTAHSGTDASDTYGITVSNTGVDAFYSRMWEAATADAYIDLLEAYGAEFDSEPNFEMMTIGSETSIEITGGLDGFSYPNLATQMARIVPAARAAWPHTNLRVHANYIGGGDAGMLALIQLAAANAVGIGGPDTIPHEDIQANYVYAGEYGGTDYRGSGTPIIPFSSELQSPSLCDEKDSKPSAGAAANYTYSDFLSHAMNGNASATLDTDSPITGNIRSVRPSHFITYVNHSTDLCSVNNQRWGAEPPTWTDTNTGGALDFIQTNPALNTTCPSSYSILGGCNTAP